MIAAQRFEIARDEGDDLVMPRQRPTGVQRKRRIRIGLENIGGDTLVDDVNFLLRILREGRALPSRRRDARVAFAQGQQGRRVLQVQADVAIGAGWPRTRDRPDVLILAL